MKLRLPLAPALAVATGLIVLAGYFVDVPVLLALRLALVDWAGTLAAVALLLGVFSLLGAHWDRIVRQRSGWPYSIFLMAALLITLGIVAALGPAAPASVWIFQYLETPLETALTALLAVTLVLAGFRLLNRRRGWATWVFLLVAALVLVGSAPLPGAGSRFLSDLRAWIAQVPAVAGARGILIGVALGSITTGLRVLLAADRPYGD